MKVVRHSSEQLTLRLRPWLIWFVSAACLWVGSIFPVSMVSGNHLALQCYRIVTPNKCQLWQRNIWMTSSLFILDDLQGAVLQSKRRLNGSFAYRVVLKTQQESIPLTSYYRSGYSEHQDKVNQVNAFLQDEQQFSLRIEVGSSGFIVIIALLFGILLFWGSGLLVLILFGQISTCDFDKRSGQLWITQKRLLRTTQIQRALNAIVDVKVVIAPGSGTSEGATYRVCLVMRNGDVLTLVPYSSSRYAIHLRTAKLIREFLNLP